MSSGRTRASAILSGIVIGHLGAVRELVTRMRERLGGSRPATVIVTGGLAAAPWARKAWLEPAGTQLPATAQLPAIANALDPELVLKGLGLLAERLGTRSAAELRS